MLAFVFSALVVLLDQFFKRWVVRSLALFENREAFEAAHELIPGVIGLTYLENTGAAFGIFAGQRWPLAAIAFAACLVLVFVILRYTEGFWGTLGLSAVLGGAVGNLIDRIIYGHVVDMFRTLFIDFAIFNIADIFITLGFITFAVHFIGASVRQAKEDQEAFENAKVDLDDEFYDDADESYYETDEYDDPYAEFDLPQPYDGQPPDYENFPGTPVITPDTDTDPDLSEIREYIENAPEQVSYSMPMQAAPQEAPQEETQVALPVEQPAELPKPTQPASWQEYYEAEDKSGNSTLDALSALELELGAADDYDVDALLKEYGFEDSKKH